MNKKIASIILAMYFLCLGAISAQQPSTPQPTPSPTITGPTITEQQKDTILYMAAQENPNYDIALVVDISGSMKGTLEKFKERAIHLTNFAKKDDTLILIKFDDSTRKPLIQEIKSERDLKMFNSWIRKLEPTNRFGTDIEAAYYTTLKTLTDLNDARKAQGKPMRIQYVVFISDGDDIPPANSPFRNMASEKKKELLNLIDKASREQFIKIIPVGMNFNGYIPQTTRLDPSKISKISKIKDPELQKFLNQLQEALKRNPNMQMGSSTKHVPMQKYQFLIDWLSDKISVTEAGVSEGEEKHSRIYSYRITSDFNRVALDNIRAEASFDQSKGDLKGRITDIKISSTRISNDPDSVDPESSLVEVTVLFPQNWSLKARNIAGTLTINLSGDMLVETEVTQIDPATSREVKKTVSYLYPFNPKTESTPVNLKIPTEKLLFLLLGLILLAIIAFPAAFIYQVIVPITVTIKHDEKSQAYELRNNEKITIGNPADFQIPGVDGEIAEIQRRFRRFVLEEK
ncbi:MAG: vWA domain-containing protein, partial [Vulcanimicrobiota bacterium]